MLRTLVFFLVVIILPARQHAAPTKRVVTLEAVFDSTDKRLSLNSEQIHGHYSRFMELSGKGNLCPRTITHLNDGSNGMNGISLPHKQIKHDGRTCQDEGKLVLKHERKLTSETIATIFGLQEDVTGFKASIRRVLLSLDGFYIGVENATRSCGSTSLANGAAVIITSDSEPFGKEFHIPFHGHPKVMLINDRHKACALTSSWGSPSPIPVQPQPTETSESRYGPVSATISPSPIPPSSQPPMPAIESTTQTSAPAASQVMPSSTPRQQNNADDTDKLDAETPVLTQPPSAPNREAPKKENATNTNSLSPDQSQEQRSPETATATHTGIASSEGEQPSSSAAASMTPTSPIRTKEPESAEETVRPSASPSQSAYYSSKRTKEPESVEETIRPSASPSQSAYYSSTTPSPSTTSKLPSSEETGLLQPSKSRVSTSPTSAPRQSSQPISSSPEVSSINVLSGTGSPKPSIYPDPSKAPRIVDMVPKGNGSPKQLDDLSKKGKKSSEEEVVLTGHSPLAKPSTGGPLIFFGQKPSASLLPSPEVSSIPLVQESPSALNDPEKTASGASQSPTASSAKPSKSSSSTTVVAEEDGSACFPADAMAVEENGNLVRVEDLQVGNKVMVGEKQFSHIIDFSHADGNIVFPFDHFIAANGKTLTVTSSHYIYTQRGLLPAREVSPSDSLVLSNGRQINVTAKTQLLARGLFNPHTLLGDIIIDGFKVTTYTSAVEPTVAHALMAPLRLLDMLGSRPTLLNSLVQSPLLLRYFNIRSSS